jgi:hypothetical protein
VKPEKLFDELKAVAKQVGVEVIIDKGNFRGGSCVVHTEKKIVVNKLLPPEGKAAKLAESLKELPLEGIYLKPALREYLEVELTSVPATRRNKNVKHTSHDEALRVGADVEEVQSEDIS